MFNFECAQTSSAYKAIHKGIETTKRFAEERGSLALNVAMEIRFTKHSDSPLSPAYGHEVRFWSCWIP